MQHVKNMRRIILSLFVFSLFLTLSCFKVEKDKNTQSLKRFVLKNGLVLLIEELDHFKSTSIGFYLKKGSRDESPSEKGYTHFSEHMLFKGTYKYSKEDIVSIFDSMGGNFNAYTSRELVGVYATVPYFNTKQALELISDIINNSTFNEKELELERNVVLNEINMSLESPQRKIREDFMFNLFQDSALGSPISGNTKSISNVTRDDLFSFYEKNFYSDDIVVVISGKIDFNDIYNYLSSLTFRRDDKNVNKVTLQSSNINAFTTMPSEQIHILTGTTKFNITEENVIDIQLLNMIVGESMSSRLFQEVRDNLGLCYSIYSYIEKYREESLFAIYVSKLTKDITESISAISNVIKKLIDFGITEEELEKVKQQRVAEIMLNSDKVESRMRRIASYEINYNMLYNEDEIVKKIQDANVDKINSLIKEIFKSENFFTQGLYKESVKIPKWDF
jgi:predicted Zn-dependent peptidase